MTIDTETPTYTPLGYSLAEQVVAMPIHWHSPEAGGEIAWNNIDVAKRYNAFIEALKQTHPNADELHYIETPVLPSRGFNQHFHTNFADGGSLYGCGMHDHSGPDQMGYAFCCFSPGTSIPPFRTESP